MARTRKHKYDEYGRECSLCGKHKPWDEYYDGAGRGGKDTRCKECMRSKTRSRNKLPDVQLVEQERWKSRWEAAHPGEEYVPRARKSAEARNAVRLLRLFGITPEERQLLDEQAVYGRGMCDLHGGPETMTYQRHGGSVVRGLSIDHDHGCGRHSADKGCRYCIRGLVCCECNRTIIRMADKHPELAKRFADYLERRPLLGDIGAMLIIDAESKPESLLDRILRQYSPPLVAAEDVPAEVERLRVLAQEVSD